MPPAHRPVRIEAGRRERQKQERQRRILRAATELFEKRGFAGTSIEDIAANADLAVGTIYNYFASKPKILLAILRGETRRALQEGEAILKRPPSDPALAVGKLLTAYARLATHHDRRLWRELCGAIVASPNTLGRDLFGEDLRLIEQLQALLQELADAGSVDRKIDLARASVTLYGVFMSWCLLYSTNEDLDVEQLDREILASAEIVVNGLRAREPGETS